jgi:hypothetical protein
MKDKMISQIIFFTKIYIFTGEANQILFEID